MKNFFLLFSHTLTPDQVEDAKQSLGVSSIVSLPADLQQLFSNVPSDLHSIEEYLLPIKKWLTDNVAQADYVLIQGDFGATYSLVSHAGQIGAVPIYATTERKSVEVMQPDGTVLTQRVFKHKIFRKY